MINKLQLLGRVGKIDIKSTNAGNKLCNLTLVTVEKWTDKKSGQKQEKQIWHSVTLFAGLCDIIDKYVNTGDLLFVEGRLENEKYLGHDGVERTRCYMVAKEITLIPKSTPGHFDPLDENLGNSQTTPY